MPPIPTPSFCGLGASSIEGIVGVWLGRRLGSFALLCLEQGRMSFSQGLVMAQLALAIQVPNTRKGQLYRGYQLHWDLGGRPGFSCLIYGLAQVGQLVIE